MPILKILLGVHDSRKPLFASLTAFLSRFRLRAFRQPFTSERRHSFERLNPHSG
jgi:hypothetical protein